MSLLVAVALGAIVVYFIQRLFRSSRLPLPPGPKKKFLVGNMFDMPTEHESQQYHEWAKEHDSDIIHLKVATTNIIVLDSVKAVEDLLDKRSSIYSSRPRTPMLSELMGWHTNFGFMPYNDKWRAHRRLFTQEFNPTSFKTYFPDQLRGTHHLLRNLLDKPEAFENHLRYWAGSLVLSMAYGIEAQKENDPYIAIAHQAIHALVLGSVPGAFVVDALPILKFVPTWVPGAAFKQKALEWRKDAEAMAQVPFETSKKNVASGSYKPSLVTSALAQLQDLKIAQAEIAQQEQVIKATALTTWVGASDTTVSAMSSFILTMTLYPEIQKRAQAELDSAYGLGHIPDFADFEKDFEDFTDDAVLPFVNACFRELLRYQPVTPFAIPHLLTEDDVYKGYHLPSGSVVIGNTWAILRDEASFGPETHKFKPERFLLPNGKLNPNMKNPQTAAFGYGRRLCPGRALAVSSVWIAISQILSSFTISKALSRDGKVIEPSAEYSSGIITYPLPFKCKIEARSPHLEATIRATEFSE